MKKLTFIDLFSGAGGMSFGFKSHPAFKPIFAVDFQSGKPSSGRGTLECNKTYEANIGIKVHEADLAYYDPVKLLSECGLKPGELSVLVSCAPCTGFSRTLRKNHLEDDPRNQLVERTGVFVENLRPSILLMENARELVKGNFSHHCHNLADHLTTLGYSFLAEVYMLSDFGLPQIRERALIFAVRDNGSIKTLKELWQGHTVKPDAITVRHAIEHFPPLQAGEKHHADPAHVSPKFTRITFERLAAIPKDGGSWRDLINHPDHDRFLIPSMRRSVERGDLGSHPDVYGRLWWDRPCVTIKRECAHVGNGRYSHPEQNRQCTVRELASLNGFPYTYRFEGCSLSNKYRHIGDAVPPLISYQLAHLCYWMLEGKKPDIEECILTQTSLKGSDIIGAPFSRTLFTIT